MTTNEDAEALLHQLTDGRRDARGMCYLSKRQSDWLRDVMHRTGLPRPGVESPVRVGEFVVQPMGRRFARNRNGSVIHVRYLPEAEAHEAHDREAERERSRKQLRHQIARHPELEQAIREAAEAAGLGEL